MENKEFEMFVIMPKRVLYDEKISPSAKLLYAEIECLTHNVGYAYASNDYFAKLFHSTERSIIRWIAELESREYITIKYKHEVNRNSRKIFANIEISESENQNKSDFGVTKMSHAYDENVTRSCDKNVIHNNISNNNINKYTKVSKKGNKNARARVLGYQEIMEEFQVSELVQTVLWSYIQSCQLNGFKHTNEAFMQLLIDLENKYKSDDDKMQAILNAVKYGKRVI